MDPDLPFCDHEGAYPASDGIKHTCIPDPFGSADGGPGDGDADAQRTIVQLESGEFASCAVLSDGGLRCWGNRGYGELIGDNEDPRDGGDVETGGPVDEVGIGNSHICVLYREGNVRCWGDNTSGIIGYGHENPVDGPPAALPDIELGGPAQHITAGTNHTCALLESGDVRCWGYNTVGQLGLGHTRIVGDNDVPTDEDPVDVGGVVLKLVAGSASTCAVLEEGRLVCWGQNGYTGPLGYGYESHVGDTESPAQAGYVNVAAMSRLSRQGSVIPVPSSVAVQFAAGAITSGSESRVTKKTSAMTRNRRASETPTLAGRPGRSSRVITSRAPCATMTRSSAGEVGHPASWDTESPTTTLGMTRRRRSKGR